MNADQRLLAAWGVAVTTGWLLTAWLGQAGASFLGLGAAGTVIAVWVGLMAAPLALTFAGRRADVHSGAWAALVALGLAENALVARLGGEHDHSAHGHGGGHDEDHSSSGGDRSVQHGGGDGGGEGAPTPTSPDASAPQEAGHPHPTGAHGDTPHEHGADEHGADTEAASPAAGPAAEDTSASESAHDGAHDGSGAGDASLISPEVQHVSYYHAWFAIGAVGFAVSAIQTRGGARKALYGAAAALNAAMVLLLVVYPPIEAAAFLIAAAIQGAPMLIDLPLHRRAHAPGAV